MSSISTWLEDPFILIFCFVYVSAGITALSFLFTESIKNVLERFKLSENFVGSSLLAMGTSLSETINAITAGIYDRGSGSNSHQNGEMSFSLNSLYNLTGANLVQIVFLACATIFIWNRARKIKFLRPECNRFIYSVFQGKLLLWTISTVELALLGIFFLFKDFSKQLSIGGYSVIPFLFFIIWASYLIFSKKTTSSLENNSSAINQKQQLIPKYKNIFQNLSSFSFLIVFILIFFAFAILAFLNFNLVSRFEKTLGIDKNIGLGTILSLMTSLPEFSSFFFLYKSKCYDAACSGFLGSALFNLMLPTFTQLLKGGWLIDSISENDQKSLVFWIFTILIVNICFAIGYFTNERRTFLWGIRNVRWNISWSGTIILLYIVLSLVISPMFF
ncbi:Ca2+/Na+ antiporter [Mycoplasma suis KI3806]|uniref:Ca2+/Na+ antiporter n=1 Tax=Mycoplasma suis (strain KI_3806) TaxID=708248 RepID=F0V3I6_MYCS3|nr:sodium/hydrogen exchanger [Mycoplasma suis]CBZ40408.1 Ca2+/Na+ antiporter [Mycoplasma suis KI3806]